MSRRRVTSPSVATISFVRSLFVPTHMASDFTFTPSPLAAVPSSTWPFTPTAPMRIEMSVGMDFPPSWCSVSSPEPAPGRERPRRDSGIEVDPRVGVHAGQRALDGARVTAVRGVELIGAVAGALREHHPCECALPLGVEPDEPGGHLTVHP